MKYTLKRYRGAMALRIRNSKEIRYAALDEAVNQALEEILLKCRDQWTRRTEVKATKDLVAGLDEYEWPDEASDITKLERTDLGDGKPRPVYPYGYQFDHQLRLVDTTDNPLQYIQIPGRRIRLFEVPTADKVDALHFTIYPRHVPLADLEATPLLPEELQECAIPYGLLRLGTQDGYELVDPQGIAAWASRMEERILQYVTPSDMGGGGGVDIPDASDLW